jgi:hypothetical protein
MKNGVPISLPGTGTKVLLSKICYNEPVQQKNYEKPFVS